MDILKDKKEIIDFNLKTFNAKIDLLERISTNENIFLLVYLENYERFEDFFSHKILKGIENKSLNYLYKTFSFNYKIKNFYYLDNGQFLFLIDKKNIKDDIEIFIKTIKKLQKEIKNKVLKINDAVNYDIAILLSVVYEDENNPYESARIGLKKIKKENRHFIVANNLAKEHFKKANENLKKIHLLKEAINEYRIINFYQGIINNKTKKIEKYESLVRLIDNEGKILPPFFFLDIAKKSNYYHHITKIVLDNSFQTLNKIEEDISINLSVIDIQIKEIRNKIYKLLEKNRHYSNRIVFELLEDENIKDFDLIKEFISKIKTYGVKIAIDDFGSGYSNYARILEFQPDILKIDGSLIKNIVSDSFSQSIVKSIVTFAKEQNLKTIAEFVENKEIADTITNLGIDYSQGYFYSKPSKLII